MSQLVTESIKFPKLKPQWETESIKVSVMESNWDLIDSVGVTV